MAPRSLVDAITENVLENSRKKLASAIQCAEFGDLFWIDVGIKIVKITMITVAVEFAFAIDGR